MLMKSIVMPLANYMAINSGTQIILIILSLSFLIFLQDLEDASFGIRIKSHFYTFSITMKSIMIFAAIFALCLVVNGNPMKERFNRQPTEFMEEVYQDGAIAKRADRTDNQLLKSICYYQCLETNKVAGTTYVCDSNCGY
eukprot:TCONS_00035319-protein